VENKSKIMEVLKKNEERLLRFPNVIGTGVGYKFIKKKKTSTIAIIVYVSKKLKPKQLRKEQMIPTQIEGIPTDVKETKPVLLEEVDRKAKMRPAKGGISIAHKNVTAGTLSTRIIDALNGKRTILSCNHVIANLEPLGKASKGDSILQPGPADGGTDPADRIAGLERWEPMRSGTKVDAAIATPDNDADLSDEVLDFGVIEGEIIHPKVGVAVQKTGRTTGLTEGEIVAIVSSITVMTAKGNVTVYDVIDTYLYAKGGDSGSLTVEKGTNKPVGILFAGSMADPYDTFLIRMDNICQRLHIGFPACVHGILKDAETGEIISHGAIVYAENHYSAERKTRVKSNGEFGIGCFEKNKTYSLKIEAPYYETKTLSITPTTNWLDLGEVKLTPAALPVAAEIPIMQYMVVALSQFILLTFWVIPYISRELKTVLLEERIWQS